MVKILAIDAPERLAQIVDEMLQQFKVRLETELYRIESGSDASQVEGAALSPNQRRVRALIGGCRIAGREIRKADVIEVCNIDESSFYKWQRGVHVADKLRRRVESVLDMSAAEFLSILDAQHARFTPKQR